MALQIKATIEFIKSNLIDNTRTVESVSITGTSKKELQYEISNIIDSWTSTEFDDLGKMTYQCYLKTVNYYDINIAPVIDSNLSMMTSTEILNYISTHVINISKDERLWVNSEGNILDITHRVKIENKFYDGMTLADAIVTHINS
ncbi:hypothetical protein [Yersinia phage fHe-Yen9-04]|uniref:Uncharacterized protein n=2 Tax=Eneladusvirus Yen904 TaxID=2560849 RepID=A0A2C9CY27_9CAUD|nr:hypothetical protein FDJ41_gp439 [Yersinia phage fHe-Yen9-04]SOK58741.1 hypothetical protein [Yersinia phage fHe-Yen9-04]SOK59276.1 hypothetical protein [Yersinia phage fHe-Yen9-03]VUE36510.1 hypothetical protein [Yersinia phage fHe-Yen9-04]